MAKIFKYGQSGWCWNSNIRLGTISMAKWTKSNRSTEANPWIRTYKPGKGHTRHNHEDSEEFIYFLEGKANQTIENEDGVQEKELGPGEMVYIPQGAYHSTINVGDGDLVFLCCYLNAGSELAIAKDAIEILPPKNNWKKEE